MIAKQLRAILQHCRDDMPVEVFLPAGVVTHPSVGHFTAIEEAKYFREMPDSQCILMITVSGDPT